ncbi:MAG: alpha/beta fold hydrolase [Acidobacteriota bacterium]|nr:alpha/beta fold hydrolase [Acidobacteriota bacterium]
MASFVSGSRSIAIDEHEPANGSACPAIVLLHGSGGTIGFWADRFAPQVTAQGVALYCVHYFDRTGTRRADAATILDGVHYPQWLETVGDALRYVRARPRVDASRVALLGISLGAFLALSAAADGANRVRAVVEISGGMPEAYAPEVTAAFPPTLILHGDADTVVPVAQAQALDALLTRAGVRHRTEILEGQGHWFDGGAQVRILMATAEFLRTNL